MGEAPGVDPDVGRPPRLLAMADFAAAGFLRPRHRPARRRSAGRPGIGGRWGSVDWGLTDHGPPATDTRPPILTDQSPQTTGSPSVGGFRTEAGGDTVSNFRGRIPRLHQAEDQKGVRAGWSGAHRWAVGGRRPTTVNRRPIPTDHEPAVHRRETWTGSSCNPQPTAPLGSLVAGEGTGSGRCTLRIAVAPDAGAQRGG